MTVVALHTRPRLPTVALPSGRWHEHLWISDRPLTEPDLYRGCVAEFDRSGLWPVLVPDAERWALSTSDGSAGLRWLPLARDANAADGSEARSSYRGDRLAEAGNLGWVRAALGGYRLALIPAGRPANVPASLGWSGIGPLSAMLRSWENRFGATMVTLGADVLELAVAAPPRSLYRALLVATEHRAFCPEAAGQESLRELAKGLVNRRFWHFRWS